MARICFGFKIRSVPPPDRLVAARRNDRRSARCLSKCAMCRVTRWGMWRTSSTQERAAFVGDVLFVGSIGRTDLPGGDYDTLIASITDQLLTLPDEFMVYSGHGPPTTIGAERRRIHFCRGDEVTRFPRETGFLLPEASMRGEYAIHQLADVRAAPRWTMRFLTHRCGAVGVEHRAAAGAEQDRVGRRDGHCDDAVLHAGHAGRHDGVDHQHPVVHRRGEVGRRDALCRAHDLCHGGDVGVDRSVYALGGNPAADY